MRVKINTKKKKIVFITGTRADFGKIKSLIEVLCREKKFEVHVFATGMHMSSRYGMTVQEIYKCGFKNIFEYRNGVHKGKHAPHVLSSTISGFDKYIKKLKPDLIVVHGDRVEALAGALVGSLNNILVGHVEGGEVSGTIDDHIRHSLSKLSNLHFVANEKARKRLIQMGESESDIFVIGSPDLDIMLSDNLPTIEEVKEHYEIPYDKYAVVLYHPVFTEYHLIKEQTKILVDALILSKSNYVVIYPNNDLGSEIILDIYKKKLSN
ncbi:MAG: UDP-N-acetylglucosamine 2-epimerase, partial [bacterium]|nr:UDP-N-acetylglucosamine 2-epimerase [bacterium]